MGRLLMYHPEIYVAFLCEFHALQGPRIVLAVSSGSPGSPDITPFESGPSTLPMSPFPSNSNSTVTQGGTSSMSTRQELSTSTLSFPNNSSVPVPPWESEDSMDSTTSTAIKHENTASSTQRPSFNSTANLQTGPSLDEQRHRPLLSDMFDSISEFLIPKPPLCGSLTSITVDKYRMVGHPVLLEDAKYPRNVALWNVVLVVDRGADCRGLNACVTKLAKTFKALELELEYVTNPKNQCALYAVLAQIVHDLNTLREVRITLPYTNLVLDMKLAPITPVQIPKVHSWQVPVLMIDFDPAWMTGWDVALRRILPLINGIRPIGVIAQLADMDSCLVRITIQHLLATGVVILVDLFQSTNVYMPTARLRQAANDPWLQLQCIQYCVRPQHSNLSSTNATPTGRNHPITQKPTNPGVGTQHNDQKDNNHLPSQSTKPVRVSMQDGVPVNATGEINGIRIVSMYAAMKPGLSVLDWTNMVNFPVGVADVRRFVTYGVMKGWIRRIHEYPVDRPAAPTSESQVLVIDTYGKVPSKGMGGVGSTTYHHCDPQPGKGDLKTVTLIPTAANTTTIITNSLNATTISKSVGAGPGRQDPGPSPVGPLSWPLLNMRGGEFASATDDSHCADKSRSAELLPLDGMCVEFRKTGRHVKDVLMTGKRVTWVCK